MTEQIKTQGLCPSRYKVPMLLQVVAGVAESGPCPHLSALS